MPPPRIELITLSSSDERGEDKSERPEVDMSFTMSGLMLDIKVRALQEVELNSTSYESYYRQARDILGEVPYMPVPIKSPFAGNP